jgi:hypothetical protein
MSLGGYLAIRAAHEPRVKAVAAVSPPYRPSTIERTLGDARAGRVSKHDERR